ncbi:hypothetical protein [Thermococcus sp.]|uniref:hypothetical protein n=1 Tax=Thermococcus sp. TaxID=35749 RepID=UPI0019BE637A|nr:hypothetical protein [Thermococcus sp.]MBC7094487.1 hypothetical protein [Thermococcus sp.]
MKHDEYLERAVSWYRVARHQNDPFLEFAINYLVLEALLHWLGRRGYCDQYGRDHRAVTSRRFIECLKRDRELKRVFLEFARNIDMMPIIERLSREPLRVTPISREERWDGRIKGVDDFYGIIEFIYQSRNNLFHGHKSPGIDRDIFIVENANRLLMPLIEAIMEVYGPEDMKKKVGTS